MKLDKVAEDWLSPESKHELVSTGVIGAVGAGTSALANAYLHPNAPKGNWRRAAIVGGGLGLLGDYAAVKINKKLAPLVGAEGNAKTMNKVASILLDKARELRESTPEIIAVSMLKQAGMSDEDARYEVAQQGMEKVAFSELSYSGIDVEEATRLVKAANINVRELQGIVLVTEEEALADTLEKVAAYISEQDEKIEQLEKFAQEAALSASATPRHVPDNITKMASVGAFTFKDLEALKAMPSETLTKVASAMDQPWEFGKAAGIAQGTGDPILDFCLGS